MTPRDPHETPSVLLALLKNAERWWVGGMGALLLNLLLHWGEAPPMVSIPQVPWKVSAPMASLILSAVTLGSGVLSYGYCRRSLHELRQHTAGGTRAVWAALSPHPAADRIGLWRTTTMVLSIWLLLERPHVIAIVCTVPYLYLGFAIGPGMLSPKRWKTPTSTVLIAITSMTNAWILWGGLRAFRLLTLRHGIVGTLLAIYFSDRHYMGPASFEQLLMAETQRIVVDVSGYMRGE